MLNYHINKFKLSDQGSVLFLQLLSFLGHKFLNVIVLFICNFEFVVNFSELLTSVFDLFLQRKILFINVLHFNHFLTQLLGKSTLLLSLVLKLLLGFKKFLVMDTGLLFEFISSHKLLLHLLQFYSEFFLLFSLQFFLLINFLGLVFEFICPGLLLVKLLSNFLFLIVKSVLELLFSF